MKHNIGISGIRVKSNSLLLALFLLLVWCVQIVPGLGNAYAQYVYPAIARVLSSSPDWYQVLSMGPKRLVLTLAIQCYALYFVQLRIAKVKTSLLGPIDTLVPVGRKRKVPGQ